MQWLLLHHKQENIDHYDIWPRHLAGLLFDQRKNDGRLLLAVDALPGKWHDR
jgi:hypothetical protein